MSRLRLLLLLVLYLLAACATRQQTAPIPLPTASADWPLTPSGAAPLDSEVAWQTWPSLRAHSAVAFAPDGALWVPTGAGVLRWDIARDAYTWLSTGAGLPHPWVSAVAPAPDGVVWLAHWAGVTRLNGADMVHFTTADGLPADHVTSVALMAGSVWAGTENGLARLEGGRWVTVPIAGVANRPVNRLLTAPDGLLWLQSPDGIFSYEPRADRWAWPSGAAALPGPTGGTAVTGTLLAVDPQGRPWVNVPYGQTYRLEDDGWAVVYPSDGSRFACGVAFAEPQTVYLATCYDGGLGLLRQTVPGGEWVPAGPPDYYPDVHQVAVGPDGAVVAVAAGKLFAMRNDVWRELRAGPGPLRVTALQALPGDEVWLAFGDGSWRRSGGGLVRRVGEAWQQDVDAGAAAGNLRAFALGADGTLYAGGSCVLARRGGGIWETLVDCDQLLGDVVDIAVGDDGVLWTAHLFGLGRYDGAEWQATEHLAHTVAAAPDGGVTALAWTGQAEEYELLTWTGAAWSAQPASHAERIRYAPDGTLWGLKAGGVAPWTAGGWGRHAALDLGALSDLVVAPDGTLWVAAEAGVARLQDGVWQRFPTPERLYRISVDDKDVVWGTLSAGVARLLPGSQP